MIRYQCSESQLFVWVAQSFLSHCRVRQASGAIDDLQGEVVALLEASFRPVDAIVVMVVVETGAQLGSVDLKTVTMGTIDEPPLLLWLSFAIDCCRPMNRRRLRSHVLCT